MDKVAFKTNISPPWSKLPPHISFHRPLAGADDNVFRKLATETAHKIRQTNVVLHGLFPYGKQYIVLPVHATRSVARLWVGISDLVSHLPGYEHGEHDDDNTLHITIATKTSEVFDREWPTIEKIRIKPMIIPLRTIALYRKPEAGEDWKMVQEFHIPM